MLISNHLVQPWLVLLQAGWNVLFTYINVLFTCDSGPAQDVQGSLPQSSWFSAPPLLQAAAAWHQIFSWAADPVKTNCHIPQTNMCLASILYIEIYTVYLYSLLFLWSYNDTIHTYILYTIYYDTIIYNIIILKYYGEFQIYFRYMFALYFIGLKNIFYI